MDAELYPAATHMFEAHGFKAAAVRAVDGLHWCGYVGVPHGHPLWGVGYDDNAPCLVPPERWEIWRADTNRMFQDIANEGDWQPEMVLEVHGDLTYSRSSVPGVPPDGLWWFGFDCAHSGDWCPASGMVQRADQVYRTLGYVEAECATLAQQLAALAPIGISWTVTHANP